MPEHKGPLQVIVNDDKTLAKVRATMMPLTAKGIEDAIGALAVARSQMQPAVPTELPADYTTHRHQATHYNVAWDFLTEMPSLSFRSPAFGWLTFLISNEEVQALCDALTKVRETNIRSQSHKQH